MFVRMFILLLIADSLPCLWSLLLVCLCAFLGFDLVGICLAFEVLLLYVCFGWFEFGVGLFIFLCL